MNKLTIPLATTAAVAAAVGVCVPSFAATATPGAPALSSIARQHGLTSSGGAVMGWRSKTTTSTASVAANQTFRQTAATAQAITTAPAGVPTGIDVAAYTGTVNWASFKAQGLRFAFIKATEGTYYTSTKFATQSSSATTNNVVWGAYHFANPAYSSASAQADYFVAHGGAFSVGANRMPGALDLEWDPYSSNACYGLTQSQMYSWISAFQTEYKAKTGSYPIIYTAQAWWNTCVGTGVNSAVIAARSPLWDAYYASTVGPMPSGYMNQMIWQNSAISAGSYDTDIFNGGVNQLTALTLVGGGGH